MCQHHYRHCLRNDIYIYIYIYYWHIGTTTRLHTSITNVYYLIVRKSYLSNSSDNVEAAVSTHTHTHTHTHKMYLGDSFITTASQIITTPAIITPYYTAAVYQEQEEAFAQANL